MHGKLIPADDGRIALRFERVLAQPREKVWLALTESEHLRNAALRTDGARLDGREIDWSV